MDIQKIAQNKPIISVALLGGIAILLAGFISIPREDETFEEKTFQKFEHLAIKDSVMQAIRNSSLRRVENEKVIYQYDQRTDYQYFHRSQSIREMLLEERELLKSTLEVWQQSEYWKEDSIQIVSNLSKQKALESQIEKSLTKLK